MNKKVSRKWRLKGCRIVNWHDFELIVFKLNFHWPVTKLNELVYFTVSGTVRF